MTLLRIKLPKYLFVTFFILTNLLILPTGEIKPVSAVEGDCSAGLFEYQMNIDGVDLNICLPYELEIVNIPTNEDIYQVASSVSLSDQILFMIQAVPYEFNYRIMKIPVPKAGNAEQVRNVVAEGYLDMNNILSGPKASFFGAETSSEYSFMPSEKNSDSQMKVLKNIWVTEAGNRVWIIHFEQEFSSEISDSAILRVLEKLSEIEIVSKNLEAPSSSMALGALEVERFSEPSISSSIEGDLPTPPWWNGDCDVNFHPGSYPLGGIYRGVKACGPRPFLAGVESINRKFFSGDLVGGWEWECAEYSKRYLYQGFGQIPYYAHGKDIVNNYPGSNFTKVTNGSVGKAPIAGDVLSYSGPNTSYGHTSIVKSSSVDSSGNGSIVIVEQNNVADGEDTLSVTNWFVNHSFNVTNWLHQPTQDKPSGYVYCANEGGRCNFSGSATIAFGANGVYTYKNLTGGTDCNTSVFGDPISGVQKACYINGGGPVGYTFCASENQRCNVPALANVAYGASLSYLYKNNVTGGVDCNSATFGGDPISGIPKGCYYQLQNAPQENWTAKYYSTHTYWWDDQSPQYYQCEESISSNTYTLNKDYGTSAPCSNGMSGDDWVGNYTASINFPTANYVYWIDHDDGLKLWLDGVNIADVGGSGSNWVCPARSLTGIHSLRAKLKEDGGSAKVIVSWSTDTSVCDAPMPFSKLLPYHTSNNISASTTISWNSSTKATSYDYCIDTNNNNACDTSWTKLSNVTSTTLSGLSSGTTYYWQVRGVNGYSSPTQADGGTWWSFTTKPAPPGDFSKISPVNLAPSQPTNPTLSWGASARASGYVVCYDTINDNVCNTDWLEVGSSQQFGASGLSNATQYYWQVKAINTGGETTANSGTWWSFTVQAATFPDIMVQSITPSSFNPILNEPVTFTVRIKNQGAADVTSGFYVDLFLDTEPGGCGSDGTYRWTVGSLAAGATTDLTVTHGGFDTSGAHNVCVFADSYCYFTEEDENNNIFGPVVINVTESSPSLPDLVVESITPSSYSPVVNEPVTFTVRIKNQGSADVRSNFKIWLFQDLEIGPIHMWSVDELAAGTSLDLNFSYEGFNTVGDQGVEAWVDRFWDIDEDNDDNNWLGPVVIQVVESAPSLPDIIIESITPSSYTPVVDEPVTFVVRIKNQGATDVTSGFYVDLFLDTEPGGCGSDGADYWVVDALGAGSTIDLTFNYSGFDTSGVHNVYVFADSYCFISEEDENNNIPDAIVLNVTENTAPSDKTSYLPLILRSSQGQWNTILYESFEGDFPGPWEVREDSNQGYEWDDTSCMSSAGTWSGWVMDGGIEGEQLLCGSNYVDDFSTWMIYGPFDLSDATRAELSFHLWLLSEPDYDYMYWGASEDGLVFTVEEESGNSDGWVRRNLDLSNVRGQNFVGLSQVWIGFNFASDSSVNYPIGAVVDEVLLRKCVGGTCP